jgi:hypothetical protein
MGDYYSNDRDEIGMLPHADDLSFAFWPNQSEDWAVTQDY